VFALPLASTRHSGFPQKWQTTKQPESGDAQMNDPAHEEVSWLRQQLAQKEEQLAKTSAELEATRLEADQFRRIFQASADAILITDDEDRILDVNPAANRLLGYTRDEFLQKKVPDLIAPEYHFESGQHVRTQLATETPRAVLDVHKDGRRIPIEVHSAPLFVDESGRTVAVSILRDVTAHHQAEKALRRAHDELATRITQMEATNQRLITEIQQREQTEQELRAIRERLELAIAGTGGAIWDQRLEGARDFEDLSDDMFHTQEEKDLLGYALDEAFPAKLSAWDAHVLPEDQPERLQRQRDHFEGKTEYLDHEYRVRRKDGAIGWIHGRSRILRDEDGKPLRWIGIDWDVTELKRTEEELRRHRDQLQELVNEQTASLRQEIAEREQAQQDLWLHSLTLNQIEDRVIVTDLQGTITYVNDAVCRMLKVASQDLIGQHVSALGEDPIAGAAQEEIVRTALEKGKWRGEVVNIRADGKQVVLDSRVFVVRDENGSAVALCGISTDITERKWAEEALRASEKKYRLVVESLNEGIWQIDRNAHTTFVNPRMAEMLGYTEDEMLGKHLFAFMDERGIEIATQELERRRRGVRGQHEFEFRRKDGEPLFVNLETSPLLDDTGAYTGALAAVMDVTERKRLEEQIRQQERLAAVGQLAAGIAHDFNNLLTGIIGYAELLQQRSIPQEPALSRIIEQGRRAAELTRQILDFSRKSRRSPRPLDLRTFIEETVNFVARIVPENIRIDVTAEPGAYVVNADPTQMQQVITNLALNARDAMPAGGVLTVALERRTITSDDILPAPEITPGEWITLSVSDTGTGIKPEALPHLFEPFFTTKEVGKGSGLGLAQVYGIIKQHSGDILVDSQEDNGTTFTIFLSPSLAQASAPPPPISTKPPSGHGECILLVEDNPTVRDFVRNALDKLGYQVLTAQNGEEAMSIYERHHARIGLVLTDAIMPHMDGFTLLRTLRSAHPDVKVLMMSGYPEGGRLTADERQNVRGWLEKPPSLKVLAQAVRAALD
jgi:two-component system, cell cycle sensor histidine kinase and response regulator CckA